MELSKVWNPQPNHQIISEDIFFQNWFQHGLKKSISGVISMLLFFFLEALPFFHFIQKMRQLASSLPDMDGSGYGNMKRQYEELAGRYALDV